MVERPPVLLAIADYYYGTLAAARTLGRAGIGVAVADPNAFAAARWSRLVARRLICPSLREPDRFMEWVLRFGDENEKHVLYPTNDDTAWLFALHEKELAPRFHLYQPPVDVVYGLLNKRRLFAACRSVGIDVPHTWFATSEEAVREAQRDAKFPVLIKPVTQVLFTQNKGCRVDIAAELPGYLRIFDTSGYSSKIANFDPGVRQPAIQEFYPDAAEAIYGLSGFVDETGSIALFRASRKVLQRPRKVGVGLCFESAEVDRELASRVLELFLKVGYFGVFEVEFIISDGRALLIDANPRFYNQMVFDCGRGLPLPLFAYHAALRQGAELDGLTRRANDASAKMASAHTHRFTLELYLFLQRAAGGVTREERERWRAWLGTHKDGITDASFDPDDLVPAVVDAARHVFTYARHPRAFLRSVVFDR